MPTGVAIAGAGLLGAGAAIYGANKQSRAAKDAARTAQGGLNWEKQRYFLEQARRDPYYKMSLKALPGMEEMMSGDYDPTTTKQYGLMSASLGKGAERLAAAKGLNISGKAIMDDTNIKANLANALTTQRWNMLSSAANLGSMGFAQSPNVMGGSLGIAGLQQQAGAQEGYNWAGIGALPMQGLNTYAMYNYLNNQSSSPYDTDVGVGLG